MPDPNDPTNDDGTAKLKTLLTFENNSGEHEDIDKMVATVFFYQDNAEIKVDLLKKCGKYSKHSHEFKGYFEQTEISKIKKIQITGGGVSEIFM